MDCRQAGPYIDPSIISRMARCLRGLCPYRLLRADSWRQAEPLWTPSRSVFFLVAPRAERALRAVSCPQQHNMIHRSDRGARCTRPHVDDAPTMQSIPEGATCRGPMLCERYNGLRDPNMTPALSGRVCYSRIVHTLVASGFLNYLMLQPGSHYPKC